MVKVNTLFLLAFISLMYINSYLNELIPSFENRIVGGLPSSIKDFPWQVSLQMRGLHFCGGSIISNLHILTAAHCLHLVKNVESPIEVRIGSRKLHKGGKLYNSSYVMVHPLYNPKSTNFDVGIIKLNKPIKQGNTSRAIQIVDENKSFPTNTIAYISGWGHKKENGEIQDKLRSSRVKIIDYTLCKKYFKPGEISENMLCAGNPTGETDSCQGDSGGPLVIQNKLVGVVSWGIGCGRPYRPAVYANLANLRQFIDEAIRIKY
ncbi:unnamed protein product [Brassicogethes aeneus]|uniref:Peptidase S1 domain-containing protein n=1 Tax=Brassicogethes aeneus TaxID=1431903 RepID=A0A9P0B1F9_BRAAE|nr:unnamed protein product [Brassicogethes aeneus]